MAKTYYEPEEPQALMNTAGVRVWLTKTFYEDYHNARKEGDWNTALESLKSVWMLAHSRMDKEERKETWDLYTQSKKELHGKRYRDALGNIKFVPGSSDTIFLFGLKIEDILHKYKLGMPDKEEDYGL